MNKPPTITIAICTYNRESYLRDTLRDLTVQKGEINGAAILVIDNNSQDGTETAVHNYMSANPRIDIRYVREQKQGLSHARNRAFAEAESEYLLFIDDDVVLPAHFTESALNMVQDFEHPSCGGGRIFVQFDNGDPDWIPRELMPMFGLHDLGDASRPYPPDNFPRGGNMLIHRTVFEAVGEFDPHLGRKGKGLAGSEEKAFFAEARERGFPLLYLPQLELHHRIGADRLQRPYLMRQSQGIGTSEYVRLRHSPIGQIGKLASECVKGAGSVVLALLYLLRGKTGAAKLLLLFRWWVLQGFFRGRQIETNNG
ncbi:MAG: glycosyltransferase [Balneolaceae bacterium]